MNKKKQFYWFPLLLFLFAISFFFNIYLVLQQTINPIKETTVIGVIDGDTLLLEGKTRVRLRHVDSPELDYCGGTEAKQALEELVLGKTVHLEELIPDQRGRGMALVYDGSVLINKEMLKSGWSRYHSDTTNQQEQLKILADQVKSEKKGIFGECQSTQNLKNPTCVIKGNIDKNAPSASNKKFYTPDCAQYAYTIVEEDIGEQWFCKEQDALRAGFIKAATCK